MNRKRFEELLPDFIENNLSGEDLAGFRAYIAAHTGAGDEVRELRRLILEVSDIEAADPGPAFWDGFLPELRTRMDRQDETVGVLERLRRVVLRPAIIGSMALATVIIALLAVFSNIGPRGDAVMEARRINSRLEAALRNTENDTLVRLETYFGRLDPAEATAAAELAAGRPQAAVTGATGDEWIESWFDLEEGRRSAVNDEDIYRLIGELTDDEEQRLAEMLRAELTTS